MTSLVRHISNPGCGMSVFPSAQANLFGNQVLPYCFVDITLERSREVNGGCYFLMVDIIALTSDPVGHGQRTHLI